MTTENIKQLWREEIERITHKAYIGLLNSRATSSRQSNHWVFHYVTNPRLQTHTTKRWLWIPQSLLTLFAHSQNHTDFTRFYNSFTKCNMNNYKKLNKGRKHLELQYTRNPIESQQSSKAILLNLEKHLFTNSW